MFTNVFILLLLLIVIIGVILFLRKSWKNWKNNNEKSKLMLLISIGTAIILVPLSLSGVYVMADSIVHPVPTIMIPNNTVKIQGTHTTGTLRGVTTPNILVKLNESDGVDNVKKQTYSNNKGKFYFSGLESDTDFKLKAINGPNSSKDMHVSIGDIPDSAYAKLSIDGADEFGDIKKKQDNNDQATITGHAIKNGTVELDDADYNKIKSISTGNDGKWSFTLQGSDKKKKVEYSIFAHKKGLEDSDTDDITITNPNYVKPKKNTTAKDTDSSEKDNQSSNSGTSTVNNKQTKGNKKSSKASKEDEKVQSFEADINAYLQNQYPDVMFNYDKDTNTAEVIVSDDVAYMSKSALKAYATPIYKRIKMFSTAENLDEDPYMQMQTKDGNEVARSGILVGVKVYASK